MAFHIPSFLAGSAVAGVTFLSVHQQLSYRNRLSYQWPWAEWAESQFREQWKTIKDRINENAPTKAAAREVASVSTYWNKGIASAKDLFDKKD